MWEKDFSLADFCNNKSVCEALARIKTTNNFPDKVDFMYEKNLNWDGKEINKLMLDHLYEHPNDAEGLAKIIKEWVK